MRVTKQAKRAAVAMPKVKVATVRSVKKTASAVQENKQPLKVRNKSET